MLRILHFKIVYFAIMIALTILFIEQISFFF